MCGDFGCTGRYILRNEVEFILPGYEVSGERWRSWVSSREDGANKEQNVIWEQSDFVVRRRKKRGT